MSWLLQEDIFMSHPPSPGYPAQQTRDENVMLSLLESLAGLPMLELQAVCALLGRSIRLPDCASGFPACNKDRRVARDCI